MEYSGVKYPIDAWNAELTLEDAFQTSCVWYFRQVVDCVGQDNVLSLLNELQYGNCDMSEWNGANVNPLPELNGFWLDSSLKILPLQQIYVLNYLFSLENSFNDKNLEVLKEVMYVTGLEDGMLYGKTGTVFLEIKREKLQSASCKGRYEMSKRKIRRFCLIITLVLGGCGSNNQLSMD